MTEDITVQEALTYEVANNWLTGYIPFGWFQDWYAKRLAKKAMRKHKKYLEFKSKLF